MDEQEQAQRRVALLLLVVGAILIAMSRVKLHAWEPFSDALAGLGFTLGALARTDQVRRRRNDLPPIDPRGPDTGPTKPGG